MYKKIEKIYLKKKRKTTMDEEIKTKTNKKR